MISSHFPTLSGQRSLAMISLVECRPNRGHAREGMDRGQGVFSTPLSRGRLLNAFHQALGVWVAVGDGGGAGAGNFKYGTKTFPDYQASVSLRGRLAASSASWLEVILVSLLKYQESGRWGSDGCLAQLISTQQTFPQHLLCAGTSGR